VSQYWGIGCAPLEAGALPSSQSPAPGTGPRPALNLMWVCGAEIANLAAVIGLLSRSPVTLGSGLSRQAVGPVASGRSALAASQTAPVANQHRKEVAPNSGSTISVEIVETNGHDTRAIQGWLGHRSITITAVYTALAPNRFRFLGGLTRCAPEPGSAALRHEGERFIIDVYAAVRNVAFTRLGPQSCRASQKSASIAATS
jgi:hypothetical protein